MVTDEAVSPLQNASDFLFNPLKSAPRKKWWKKRLVEKSVKGL